MSIHERQLHKHLEVLADRLEREFPSVSRPEVEASIARAVTPLRASVRILDFVPILVERQARVRISARQDSRAQQAA